MFLQTGPAVPGVDFSVGDGCRQGSEQVSLDHPEGWGYGVAGGVPGAHGGLDKPCPHLLEEHAVLAKLLKEVEALKDVHIIQ